MMTKNHRVLHMAASILLVDPEKLSVNDGYREIADLLVAIAHAEQPHEIENRAMDLAQQLLKPEDVESA